MNDLTGTVIDGRYRVATRLGVGGMGEVWLAHQESLGRDVALKVMKASLADDHELIERFQREARAQSHVRHENVVTVYDTGRCKDTGLLFIAMELLEGETLRARMRRGGVRGDEALDILRQVLRGLTAAHAAGIVHRDVKPENIMLHVVGAGLAPVVKLVDFGIARRVEAGDTLTQTGSFVGTPGYTAPEVALGARADDPRGDLYAVGAIAWEMLVGSPVFAASSPLALAMVHASEPAPSLATRASVAPEVTDLVARLLAKSASERPSAAEALKAIEHVLLGGAAQTWGSPAAAVPTHHPAPTTLPPSIATEAMTAMTPVPPRSSGGSRSSSSGSGGPISSPSGAPVLHTVMPGFTIVEENRWFTLEIDEARQIVRAARTARRVEIDEIDSAFQPLLELPRGIDRSRYGILFDFRAAPPRNDPAFEERVPALLGQVVTRYRGFAVLLRTAVGKLQAGRNLRENALPQDGVFTNEDDALRFLVGLRDR